MYERTTEFADISSAKYEITLWENVDKDQFQNAFEGPIVINKKSKKGMIDVDLSQGIKSKRVEFLDDRIIIEVVLNAKQESYVNPDHLMKGIGAKLGRELVDYDIMRTAVYNSKGESFR